MITEVSAKRTRSSEKHGMQRCETTFKKLEEAFRKNVQVHNQIAERIKETAKQNHEACEKAKLERRKQENDRAERKAAKEKRLSEVEAKVNVMFYGFENIKKASDESINKVDSMAERMDFVLNEFTIMREECETKDAEIMQLHSRINQQDKEIEMLKSMIAEQKRMLELYIQFNVK